MCCQIKKRNQWTPRFTGALAHSQEATQIMWHSRTTCECSDAPAFRKRREAAVSRADRQTDGTFGSAKPVSQREMLWLVGQETADRDKDKTKKFFMLTPGPIQTEPAADMRTTRTTWTGLKTDNYSLFQWLQPAWIWSRARQVTGVAHPRRTLVSHESALNGTVIHQLSERCICEDFETINPFKNWGKWRE